MDEHTFGLNGEHFWDGGYMGNPALFPLIYSCKSSDIIVVHINPILRPDVPTTAHDIMNRVTEISFNSSLMREMRAVAFVTKLINDANSARNCATPHARTRARRPRDHAHGYRQKLRQRLSRLAG
jgi:NTE family protein